MNFKCSGLVLWHHPFNLRCETYEAETVTVGVNICLQIQI